MPWLMVEDLLVLALKARPYEAADPATRDDIARNRQIAAIDQLIFRDKREDRSAEVVSLRVGNQR